MDGSRVISGDVVFDLLLGAGKVETIGPGGDFRVQFADDRFMTYTSEGFYGTTKRLFWSNPIVLTPLKGENIQRLLAGLANMVRAYRTP